ncbi:MAG: 1-acyl-sn-glycerol-3-phosphate acyltransferase [Candidatus Shapirobacteria bacterium]
MKKRYLSDFFYFGGLIKKFDKKVGDLGVQGTMEGLVKETKTKWQVEDKEGWTKEVLQKKPVIVVANHPSESDIIFILAALAARKDIYLIIDSTFMGISKNIDKHLIPVYIQHRESRGKGNFRWNLIKKFHWSQNYGRDAAHQKNIKSIGRATRRVENGAVVVIFPAGGSTDGRWFSGIGHLVRSLKNKNEVSIVKAKIEGSSKWDYFRLIPGLGRLMPKIKVTFSTPRRVTDIANEDARAITKRLETEYLEWSGVQEKPEKRQFVHSQPIYAFLRTAFLWFIGRVN